jgi:hypothetical protein
MAVLSRSGPRSTLTVRTASAPSPVSPSAAGGPSGSCVHNPLKLKRTMILRFARLEYCKVLQVSRSTWTWRRANCAPEAELVTAHAITAARLRVAVGHTQERTPTLETNSNLRTKSKKLLIAFPLSDPSRHLGNRLGARKAYAGTWPNENKFMVLVSAAPRKGGEYMVFAQEDRTCGLRASAFGLRRIDAQANRNGPARMPR